MMNIIKVAFLAGLIIAASAPATLANQWPDAFTRRDYKLGITLNEFKRIPYPDQKEARDAYSVCSDDPRSEQSGYEDSNLYGAGLAKAGVIKCAYYTKDKDLNMVFGAGIVLADIFSRTEFFFLAPENGKEPVLFWITTGGPTASFDRLVPILTKAYGAPNYSTTTLQNTIGNSFTNDIYTWRSPSSTVEFKRYGSTLKIFEIDHVLQPVMKLLNQKLGDIASDQAKKI